MSSWSGSPAVPHPGSTDVLSTRLLGATLLRPFWRGWLERLELEGGERVLDFGSGSGQLSRRIALAVGGAGRLSCLDISPRWLELARVEMADLPWVDFHLGVLSQMPRGEYDLVHAHYVLHEIRPGMRGQVAEELTARLKPAGRLGIREPLYYNMLDWKELLEIFGRTGLALVRPPERHWWLAGPVIELILQHRVSPRPPPPRRTVTEAD